MGVVGSEHVRRTKYLLVAFCDFQRDKIAVYKLSQIRDSFILPLVSSKLSLRYGRCFSDGETNSKTAAGSTLLQPKRHGAENNGRSQYRAVQSMPIVASEIERRYEGSDRALRQPYAASTKEDRTRRYRLALVPQDNYTSKHLWLQLAVQHLSIRCPLICSTSSCIHAFLENGGK